MIHGSKRFALVAAGWISLALGFIGIFLPVLPTTPFVILAAFLFSKSSPRLHDWLLSRPHLGKMVLDWERHGVIRKSAKLWSTALIVVLFAYTLGFVAVPLLVKVIISLIGVSVLLFIWTRPSNPVNEPTGVGAVERTRAANGPRS